VVVGRFGCVWQLHKNRWEPIPSYPSRPTSLQDIAACWVPGGFVITGGCSAGSVLCADVHFYKADTKSWETLPSMTDARRHHSAVYYKGSVYVVGGESTTDDQIDLVERYDFEAGKWCEVAPLPTLTWKPHVVAVNDHLYVMGGWDDYGEADLQEVYAYNDITNSWEKKADMPGTCYDFACAALNSDIFIVGGDKLDNMRYNADTDQWTIIPQPEKPYIGPGAFEMFGTVVLVDGNFADFERFDPVEGVWTKRHPFPHGHPDFNQFDSYNDSGPFEAISSAFKMCE
jgi:hypothetical protein